MFFPLSWRVMLLLNLIFTLKILVSRTGRENRAKKNKRHCISRAFSSKSNENVHQHSYTKVVKEGGKGLLQFLTPKPKIFLVKKVKVPNQSKLNFVDQAHRK